VRRAFAPLLLAGFEDAGAATVRLVAVNDRPAPERVSLRWSVLSADGRVLEERTEPPVTLAPHGACFDFGTVELLHHANREGGPERVMLRFALHAPDGALLCENHALLVPPGRFGGILPAELRGTSR